MLVKGFQKTINKSLRHTKRFQEIITVLVKYGLTDYIQILRIDRSFKFVRKVLNNKKDTHINNYTKFERVRMAIEELGPTFVKLGQLLSNRRDFLPKELITELEKLQDEVPPVDQKAVKKVLQRELSKPIEEIFYSFDYNPVASASIAQVHKAVLRNGKTAAVKIQRPGIQRRIDTDLEILFLIANLTERYIPETRYFGPCDFIKEFQVQIRIELNFMRELLHMQKFGNQFRQNEYIHSPEVYPSLTSRRMITMEFIEGVKISHITHDNSLGFDTELIAKRGGEAVLEQVFLNGFFHADPHPGNIMVLPGNRICFLDFGMMCRVRPRQREGMTKFLFGMAKRDSNLVTESLLELTKRKKPINTAEFEIRIFDLMEDYLDLSLKDLDISELFENLFKIIMGFGLYIPSNMMLMLKAMLSVQAIGVCICPDFNIIKLFEGVGKKLLKQKYKPKHMGEQILEVGTSYRKFLSAFPVDAGDILRLIKKGQLKAGIKIIGLESFRKTIDKVSYRLVFGVILAALLVSSSLIIVSALPPLWRGVPIIGLIGFCLAGLMGFIMLVSVFIRSIKDYF